MPFCQRENPLKYPFKIPLDLRAQIKLLYLLPSQHKSFFKCPQFYLQSSEFPGPFLSSLCLLGTGASSHRQDSVAAGITTTLLCSGRKNVRPFLERTTFTKSQGRSCCCGCTFLKNRRLAFSIILHELIITFIAVLLIPVGDRIIHC